MTFLGREIYGATSLQWLIAVAVLGGVYLTLSLARRLLVRRLGKLAARTSTDWDDLIVQLVDRTRWYFLLLVAGYAATRVLAIPTDFVRVLRAIAVVIVLVQTGVWGNGIIGFAADHYSRRRAGSDSGTRATIQALGYAGRFVLWSLLIITALQNFGINVTALVTGLGIGGIAIALAVQNILGDLFAALAIVLDKPFVVGDSIQVDTLSGTIEHVGLKTTRIRSVSGEQIVISNAELLKSRIRNFKRMEQRRAVFTLDCAIDTPAEKVAAIPAMVRGVIEAQPDVRFDRSHFLSIGETGLRVETVYFVLDPDYNRYADIQHAINVEVLKQLSAARVDLAATRAPYLRPATTPTG
jgi:small-conductance mechanosensitive channel